MSGRDEKKKQRRQKRLHERAQRQQHSPGLEQQWNQFRQLAEELEDLPAATFPGGSDPALARPDIVKYELAIQATEQEPGRSKLRRMEDGARHGLLSYWPEPLDDWIMEEYLWHGVPGDSWHPVDTFLAWLGDRFPRAAAEQLRLWKTAEIGLYEIGETHGDTMTLQAWDPIKKVTFGPPLHAISLNIGGVNAFGQIPGALTLTYVAPWAAAENLYCAMGYAKTVAKSDVAMLVPYLGLRHPELVCRLLPWKQHGVGANYRRQWKQRQWHAWLGERLQFPFWAIVATPPLAHPKLLQVEKLMPSSELEAAQLGIYMSVDFENTGLMSGATTVNPIDITSPNALALAEYRAHREWAGPPPGTRGMPQFTEMHPKGFFSRFKLPSLFGRNSS